MLLLMPVSASAVTSPTAVTGLCAILRARRCRVETLIDTVSPRLRRSFLAFMARYFLVPASANRVPWTSSHTRPLLVP